MLRLTQYRLSSTFAFTFISFVLLSQKKKKTMTNTTTVYKPQHEEGNQETPGLTLSS